MIIIPYWLTQIWFPALMEIVTDNPIVINRKKNLLTLPHRGQQHPLGKELTLLACRVSGKFSKVDDFLKHQQIFSCHHGNIPRKKQYDTFIKKWFVYCSIRKINQFEASLDNVIEFLSSLFEKGLGYSSINTARSALSALGLKFDSILVGQHPLIISYLRGVFNLVLADRNILAYGMLS